MSSSAIDAGTASSNNLNDVSFQTAQTSNDFDNPWESAANDETYRSSALRLNSEEEERTAYYSNDHHEPSSSSCKTRCIWWNQLCEGFLSSMFVLFFFFFYHNLNKKDALGTAILVLSAILAVLLLLRSICGGRFLRFNMNSRPCVAFIYLLTGGLLYLYATELPDSWIAKTLQDGHKEILPIACATFAVFEIVQYFVLRHYYYQEELADLNTSRYSSRFSSPWWWNGNHNPNVTDDLEEPLMNSNGQPSWTSNSNAYQRQHGAASSSSWWPFSRRRNDIDHGGARDDGSVDYASLNEDWASRSEADPHWWSREDD